MAGAAGPVKAIQPLRYFLGKCFPSNKHKSARIRITTLKMDSNLTMYFPEYKFVFAYDPNTTCKTGDTVLVRTLPERMSLKITHEVVKVVYPLGDITDPITGKKAVVGKYREEVKEINKLYGESLNAFDYDKLPPRGSQEGKRDFSHLKGVIRNHEDPNNPQPEAL